jgi:hypothetical protein
MDVKICAEIAAIWQKFQKVESEGRALSVQVMALARDCSETDARFVEATQNGQDVTPILKETRDNYLQRAEIAKAIQENQREGEVLCRKAADAFTRLISSAAGTPMRPPLA